MKTVLAKYIFKVIVQEYNDMYGRWEIVNTRSFDNRKEANAYLDKKDGSDNEVYIKKLLVALTKKEITALSEQNKKEVLQ